MKRNLHVLIIEDSKFTQEVIRGMFTVDQHISVEMLGDLASGRERLKAGGIDLVLLDLGLPDAADLTAFYALRGEFPSVPLVILTGSEDPEMELLVLEDGAQDWLNKRDVDQRWLISAARHAVIRHRLLAQKVARDFEPCRESMARSDKVAEKMGQLAQEVAAP